MINVGCSKVASVVANHFHGVTKMVAIGFGGERAIEDIVLTCYQLTDFEVDFMVSQNETPSWKHLERKFGMLCSCLKNFKPQPPSEIRRIMDAQSSQRGSSARDVCEVWHE